MPRRPVTTWGEVAANIRAVAEFECPFCGRGRGRPCTRVEATYDTPLPDLRQPHENRLALARGEGSKTMNDGTEAVRRALIEVGQPEQALAADPDRKWTTAEMQAEFEVISFAAPLVVVRKRDTGELGSLEFTHSPRVYFAWRGHNIA